MADATTPAKDNIEVTYTEDGKVIITVPEGVEVEIQEQKKEEVRVPTKLDNILTLGLTGILALSVIAVILRKALKSKKPAAPAVAEQAPVAAPANTTLAPGSAGQLKLHNVEPKTAAMAMAIVADKLGKPINELRFISIKEVK